MYYIETKALCYQYHPYFDHLSFEYLLMVCTAGVTSEFRSVDIFYIFEDLHNVKMQVILHCSGDCYALFNQLMLSFKSPRWI
jgi:hypothetical protein